VPKETFRNQLNKPSFSSLIHCQQHWRGICRCVSLSSEAAGSCYVLFSESTWQCSISQRYGCAETRSPTFQVLGVPRQSVQEPLVESTLPVQKRVRTLCYHQRLSPCRRGTFDGAYYLVRSTQGLHKLVQDLQARVKTYRKHS
jgi:hypothetical protein